MVGDGSALKAITLLNGQLSRLEIITVSHGLSNFIVKILLKKTSLIFNLFPACLVIITTTVILKGKVTSCCMGSSSLLVRRLTVTARATTKPR